MNDLAEQIAALPPEYREMLIQQLKEEGVDLSQVLGEDISFPKGRIEPVTNPEPYYPVTAAQKRFYILNQIEGAETSYNISGASVIEGKLDRDRLFETFQQLVQRHEALRTTFELKDGDLVQHIHPKVEIAIDYQEVEGGNERNGLDRSVLDHSVSEIIKKFIQQFDLTRPPLLRIKLLKIAPEKYILLYDMDHIISDGISLNILVREFASLYNGETLPELRIQYKDFAAWQKGQGKDVLERQENHWLKQFEGPRSGFDLPTDYPRPAMMNFQGAALDFVVNETLTRQLKQLAAQKEATLFMILLAGFNVLLFQLTGTQEIIIGTPVAGRREPELENIIGMFLNTLPLKNNPRPQQTFLEFLAEVKQNSLQAFENQDYQFENLLEALAVPRDLSRNPLFDILFNALNEFETNNYQLNVAGLKFSPYPLERQTTTFDLLIYLNERQNSIQLNCVYRTSLFKGSTIQYLMRQYLQLLEAIAAHPEKALTEYQVFDPGSLKSAKNTARIQAPYQEFPQAAVNQSVVTRFEEQAKQYPEQTVVQMGLEKISYQTLNQRANQLARMIRKDLTGPQPVALLFGHDPGLVTGIMGVLKSGQGYLPLDPSYPVERLAYMLSDSGATILVTDFPHSKFAGELAQKMERPMRIIDINRIDPQTAADNLNLTIPPEQVAYIKYTSGSTGKPKGIPQTHRNVLAFIRRYTNELHINPADKVALFTSYSHSAGGIDIFSMLLNGGTLYPYDLKAEGDLAKVAEWVIAEGITIFHSVPMVYRYCTDSLPEGERMGRIRLVVLGGEPITPQDVTRFHRYFGPDCVLVNMFGATEVIIGTFNLMDQEAEFSGALVPVGYPVEEVKIQLLNEAHQEVPVFGIGEIVYESEYLAQDYLNLTEKSAAVYTPNPRTGTGRVFWSGDLGRMAPDGRIEFLGRKDFQVKIRGYRIELGEIEAALDDIPGIDKSVVSDFEKAGGERYLAGYYTTKGEAPPDPKELRRLLGQQLPEYMIPAYLIRLAQLPLTPNGKIDRKALPAPETSGIDTGVSYEAPRTETEATLAEIWQEILKVERVGIHDEFFDLRGDSLTALKAVTEANRRQIDITITNLFKYKTIAKILENQGNQANRRVTTQSGQEGESAAAAEVFTIENRWPSFQAFQIDTPEFKELKIEMQRDITVYLHRALPLCIIMADPNLRPWFYERFINIFSITNGEGYLTLEYLEPWAPYREILNEISLGAELMAKETDIIQFIRERISQGYYLNIAVDEYFLPGKAKYQTSHYVHHALVYGYDNLKRQVKVIGFSDAGILMELTFHYDQFTEAYEQGKLFYRESAPWAFRTAAQLFFSNGFDTLYPFDVHKVIRELGHYLTSGGDRAIPYYWALAKENISYGFAVYEVVLRHLENFLQGQFTTDYRAIHLLAEHKKGIAERLKYIIARYEPGDRLPGLYEQYLKVVEEFNDLRLKSFDLHFNFSKNKNGYSGGENEVAAMITHIIQMIYAAKEKEQQILTEIYEALQVYFEPRSGKYI